MDVAYKILRRTFIFNSNIPFIENIRLERRKNLDKIIRRGKVEKHVIFCC